MSKNEHENQSFPRIFKGLQERTGHHKKCGTLPTIKPYLLVIRFHGVRSLTRKENSSQGSCQRLEVQLLTADLDQKAQKIHILVQEY